MRNFRAGLVGLGAVILAAVLAASPVPAFSQAAVVDSLGGATGNLSLGSGLTMLPYAAGTNAATLSAGSGGTLASATAIAIPANQSFTYVTGTTTSTLTLPSVYGQGGELAVIFTGALTLTVSAPSGFTIVGAAISAASESANFVVRYALVGTVWYRLT